MGLGQSSSNLKPTGASYALKVAASGSRIDKGQSWEDVGFTILDHMHLEENPYIWITKERYGKECKICAKAIHSVSLVPWDPRAFWEDWPVSNL